MIASLRIRNYALIATLDIDFSDGFSVITGETGAGKSILLGALGLLLGQRADAKAIKSGATKCIVEACFHTQGLPLEAFFTENDIDYDPAECLLRREVSVTGKSRAFINDTPVSLTLLKELAPQLIDIHSQHQNLLLGQEDFILDTLDALAGSPTEKEQYVALYHAWHTAEKQLAALRQRAAQDKEDTDYLNFQLAQLEEAQLQANEQEELEIERQQLAHAEEISSALYEANAYLSQEEAQPTQELKRAARSLARIAPVFSSAHDLSERLESVAIELADLNSELDNALAQVYFNPERLAEVDERLSLIYSLQKKHKVDDVPALLTLLDSLAEQIQQIENIDEHIEKQAHLVAQHQEALLAAGQALTAVRTTAANRLSEALKERLQSLGMPSVSIDLQLTPREQPDSKGLDTAHFLFSANKNVPLREVSEIASGGEIARLMLALKTTIARSKQLPTIIFDEIDTGVSGTMAEKMAVQMREMGTSCQVLCITHLPQIAALGKKHYRVFKTETETGTSSQIVPLTNEERIKEVAHMLSGEQLTEAAINNAKSLLQI